MQKDSAADLKVIQEWFETNRIRETGIIENVKNSQHLQNETRCWKFVREMLRSFLC